MNIDTINSTSVLRRCLRFIVLMLVVILMLSSVAYSQPYTNPTTVDLKTAANFRILAGSAVTINAGCTVTGDVGVSPGTGMTVAGIVNGNIHTTDDVASTAQSDLTAAYTDAAQRTADATLDVELGGKTLGCGVYNSGTFTINGVLTLSGTASDIFIFQSAATLITGTTCIVTLLGGAVWSNVFWQVGSSATIEGDFKGTILALTAITQNAGASSVLTGRALARNGAVTVSGAEVLPVELTSFTAELKNNSVELYWTTATEINNYGFNVELKIENGEWNKIGFVQGHGNSNSPKEYSFTDSPFGGTKFKYRLKQIDFDGAYEYSDEIEVNLNPPSKLTLVQNYPNPFNPTTIISFEIPVKSNVVIKVYNVIGSEIADLLNEEKLPGRHQVEFNASYLPSGIYFYSINAGELKPIMKKMILLK
jgi:hypothetical protein